MRCGTKETSHELKPFRKEAKEVSQQDRRPRRPVRVDGTPLKCRNAFRPAIPCIRLTALALGPLFRQLAQNERSLFAFLASSEPFGFQAFLREHTARDGAYRLDHLHDYVMASLGPALFAQHRGKLWAEVQSALDRLHDATEVEVRLAKTIGILQALGPAAGIAATISTLQVALNGTASETQIEHAVQALSRRSVVVFRRHTGSYALWEGSDVDIDDRLQAGRQSAERDQSLAAFLTNQVPPQPLIARRHYFQTGTLRFFEAWYFDRSEFQSSLFEEDLASDLAEADGRIVFCLPRDADDREAMRGTLKAVADAPSWPLCRRTFTTCANCATNWCACAGWPSTPQNWRRTGRPAVRYTPA